MIDEREDPLIDACLEEVLGGHTPPDLTARILRAWSVRSAQGQASPAAAVSAGNGKAAAGELPTVAAAPSRNGAHRRPRRRTPVAALVSLAVGLALVAVVVGWIAVNANRRDDPTESVARPDKAEPAQHRAAGPSVAHQGEPRPSVPAREPPSREMPEDRDHANVPRQGRGFGEPPPFHTGDEQPAPLVREAPRRRSPSPRAEVVAFMDETFEAAWKEFEVQPSPPATDAEWCRRTYLRIAGRIPTVDELNAFLADADAARRERLVDKLLASEDFAAHWSFQWTNLLIGRSGGTQDADPVSREDLQHYLREALHQNKPYDELAVELISATGASRKGEPDYNPAVNFLIANQGPRATLATARTAQVFLGKKLQCVQCHNHHASGWTQNQFWELNAFFRQMHVERSGAAARLVNRDFAGESGDGEADVYYEQPNGEMKVAYPAFGSSAAPRGGSLAEADLRLELAERIAATDDLARAAVNRLWSHFFGYGFTQPVDDMGPHNEPMHPQVLERVAGEFAAHDYDLKELVRWIALSKPFALSSKVLPENTADAAEYGEQPLFARYYTRQLQPEEVYQSLLVAAGARPGGDFAQREAAKLAWLGQFTRDMETDEGDEANSFDGAISQSLVLMNGPLTRRVVSREDGSMLAKLAASSLTPPQKVEHLFLSALARKPNRRELELAQSMFSAHDEAETLETIWWALLNSNEFILDH
jgi:hypothetical protein